MGELRPWLTGQDGCGVSGAGAAPGEGPGTELGARALCSSLDSALTAREAGALCKAPVAPTTVKSVSHVRVSFGRDSCLKAGTLMVADVCFRGNRAQNRRVSQAALLRVPQIAGGEGPSRASSPVASEGGWRGGFEHRAPGDAADIY